MSTPAKLPPRSARYFAIVPAAGSGTRMEADVPKQYLSLCGEALIEHTLKVLCEAPQLSAVVVVLAADDRHWDRLEGRAQARAGWGDKLRVIRRGGRTRAESVLAGAEALRHELAADDWLLVHDAARPLLTGAQLTRLIDEVGDDEVGGLLAVPVADTLKRGEHNGHGQRVTATVPRAQLWQAQTPQQFRAELLLQALARAGTSSAITDEASAVEALGLQPRLVQSDLSNLKITYAQDLQLAAAILQARKESKT